MGLPLPYLLERFVNLVQLLCVKVLRFGDVEVPSIPTRNENTHLFAWLHTEDGRRFNLGAGPAPQ